MDLSADHLGIAKHTVYTWITARGIPAHQAGRLWKFKKLEVGERVTSGEAADPAAQRPEQGKP